MKTIAIKRTVAGAWALKGAHRPRKIILYYHAIGVGPNAIPRQLFRRQVQWLADHVEPLSIDDLLSGVGKRPIQVSISFDDGYACVASEAAPVLREFGFSATVYVNTGWIGEEQRRPSAPELGHYSGEQFMTWKDVEFLTRCNWTIGSHGVEHLDLTTADDSTTRRELNDSKLMIEDRSGLQCRHFAYTWGRYSRRVQRAVAAAGYQTAASAIHGPVRPTSDPYALPRIDISNLYSLEDFQSIVRGEWDFLGAVQRARRVTQGLSWQ
jgi:peptidoglycan/xylan/chitin deacetylase (PgdA/CDA1 family)